MRFDIAEHTLPVSLPPFLSLHQAPGQTRSPAPVAALRTTLLQTPHQRWLVVESVCGSRIAKLREESLADFTPA